MIYTLIRKDRNGDVDYIMSFDAVTSMDESWSATVSTHVVERGFNISDNVNIEPEVYSIDAIISSYSLFKKDKEISWDGEKFSSKGGADSKSHIEARDALIKVFKSGSVISLLESSVNSNESDLDVKYKELKMGYEKETEDCVMTSLSISHPSNGTGAFYVSLKIQKVYIASVMVSELPEGDTLPTLTPREAKETSVGSSTDSSGGSGGDGGDGGAGGDAGVMPEDDAVSLEEAGGLDWYEEYQGLQRDLARIRDETAAHNRAMQFLSRNRGQCHVKPKGDTFVALCNRG